MRIATWKWKYMEIKSPVVLLTFT